MSEHASPSSLKTYYKVFIALMSLLVLTVLAAFLPFHEGHLAVIGLGIAMTIAVTKAVLVVLYFMHVRESTRLTKVFVVAGFAWLGILFALTLTDYASRAWTPASRSWVQDPLPSVAGELENASEPHHN